MIYVNLESNLWLYMQRWQNNTYSSVYLGIKQFEIWTLVPTAKKKLLALDRMFNVAVPRGYNRPTFQLKSLLKPRLAF